MRKFGDYLKRTRQRHPDNSKVVTTIAGAVAALVD